MPYEPPDTDPAEEEEGSPVCPTCDGTGEVEDEDSGDTEECSDCGGSGYDEGVE